MKNDLTIFNYENNEVRTVLKDGEVWWVLKDVCDVLEIYNSRNVMARLDEDEKGVHSTDTLGGVQQLSIINESGLYNVIFQSRKPSAQAFRRWVTHKVLPSIRKTGSYSTDQTMVQCYQGQQKELYDIRLSLESIKEQLRPKPIISDWKCKMNPKVTALAKHLYVDRSKILSEIYRIMKTEYDIDVSYLQSSYERANISFSSAFEVVEYHDEARKAFEIIVAELCDRYRVKAEPVKHKNTNRTPPLFKTDPIEILLQPLATRLHDKHPHFSSTKRKIFEKMATPSGWANRITRLQNKTGTKRKISKSDLLKSNPELFKQFSKTISDMLEEYKTKGEMIH